MRRKTQTFVSISVLLLAQLVVNPTNLLPFNFAHAGEQNTIQNNSHVTAGSNNTVYLESSEISESAKQQTQNSPNSSNASTINLSMNQGHSETPEIVTQGRYVYVLWLDDTNGNRDIYFKRSADNGNTFDHTVNLSNNPGGSLNAHMAVSENTSSLYVVWEHIPGNNGEIFFTRSTDNGATFQSPITIGNNTGLNGSPQIVESENSNVYVVWHDATNGVLLRRSTDNGRTFDSPISVSDKNGYALNPQIAGSQDNVYVAWQSNPPDGNGSIVLSRSTDNGRTFDSPISVSKEEDIDKDHILSFNPRILAAQGTNDVYLVWHSGFVVQHLKYHVLLDTFFTKSTDNAASFERPISVSNYSVWPKSDDNGHKFESPNSFRYYSWWPLEPQIAVSQDNVYVAWQSNPSGDNGEIVFSRSTDNGRTFESPISISDKNGDGVNPQIAVSQDNVYVAWQNKSQGNNSKIANEIVFSRSTDNGRTFESPISISDKNGDILNAQIAISKDSNLYWVWNSGTSNEEIMLMMVNPKNIHLNSSKYLHEKYVFPATDARYVRVTVNSNTANNWTSITELDVFGSAGPSPSDCTTDIPISGVTASGNEVGYEPANVLDNNLATRWASNGIGQSIRADLGSVQNICSVDIAWYRGNERNYHFVISTSTDGTTFTTQFSGDSSGAALNSENTGLQNNTAINMQHQQFSGDSSGTALNSENTGLQNNTAINMQHTNSKNIAFIERTFSIAAYNEAFYLFYSTNTNIQSNTTKYINLLSSKVIKKYPILPEHQIIIDHIKWLRPQSNITLLTDEDAHNKSSLFMSNGTNKYDVILYGHNEYNTQEEYNNLRQFVANGGTIIFLGANMFFTEVKYDPKSQTITLVKGHSWEFNGTSAQRSVVERWANETTEWVGSIFCDCWEDDIIFGNNPFGYMHNEEQFITNPKAKIILDYNATENGASPKDFKIATYELNYKKGKVITLGLMTTNDLFNNVKFNRFFDSLLLYYVFGEKN